MLKLNKKFVRKINGKVNIMEHDDCGIISIRYRQKMELSNSKLQRLIGSSLPASNKILFLKDRYLAWMSIDELWLLSEIEIKDKIFNKLSTTEYSFEKIVSIDLSASRTLFSLNGEKWRNIFAKGSPADVSKNAFKPGNIRRTRLGLVPVAFFCMDTENAVLICNRSVRDYVFKWLEIASKDGTVPHFL